MYRKKERITHDTAAKYNVSKIYEIIILHRHEDIISNFMNGEKVSGKKNQ